MPVSRSQGRPYAQAPRHDELPSGTPAQTQAEAAGERRHNGQLATGASTVPSLGGLAQRGRTSLSHRIAENTLDEAGRKRTRALRKALCREYRQTVGGGYCGVSASLLLRFAAILTELGEQALRAGDGEAFRKNVESVKTTLAYAREDCAKVGAARPPPEGFAERARREIRAELESPSKGGTDASE